MKILFFITNISYGGAEKMMTAVANKMAEEHDITFLAFKGNDIMQPLSDKIKYIYDPLSNKKNKLISIPLRILSLRKYIKQEKFDLAVAFLHPTHYMLTIAAKGTDTKVLLSERGDPSKKKIKYHSNPVMNFFMKVALRGIFLILQTADGYVFQTTQARDCYSKRSQKKSCVIPNPIPDKNIPDRYEGERKKTIVNVARMELVQKRQDVLIKVFELLDEKYDEYELLLYGGGPDEEKIREIAEKSPKKDKIRFMGVSKTVLEDIRDDGVFVLSSDYEGIPNALLEAMAVGLPCVSTDCSPGGARLLINDGENGLIVKRGDSESLAAAIEKLIEDKNFADRLGKNATEVQETYKKEKILNMWKEFMEQIDEEGK
ncbi:MAG: glycosyltransferase family 4 protein [Ruminococcaceae bacterium]|nr:glycosyltransferase family 4 protein [Oscillospiraceae bacterium]